MAAPVALSAPIQHFYREYAAAKHVSRYQTLLQPAKMAQPIVDYLNELQIHHFISAKRAILLKNNLHDAPFIQETAQQMLSELHDQDRMGDRCLAFLRDQVRKNQIEQAMEYLYVLMLYRQIAEEHNALAEEAFQFEAVSTYSDKLIARSKEEFSQEKLALQTKHRAAFLNAWLLSLAPTHHKEIRSVREALHSKKAVAIKPSLMRLLDKELVEALKHCPEKHVLEKLYGHLKTESYYEELVQRVRDLKEELEQTPPAVLQESVEKIQRIYNGCVFLLRDHKNFPSLSPTRFAATVGNMRTEWVAISERFQRAIGDFQHRFCSCHIQTANVDWPFTPHPLVPLQPPLQQDDGNSKTIAIVGCNWGGGHREATRGLAHAAARWGYHPVTIDLPALTVSEDPVRNWFVTRLLKQTWTVDTLYNGLIASKAYAIINVLRWLSDKLPPSKAAQEREDAIVLQHLLKMRPNAVITTYSGANRATIAACKKLGIPCIYVLTDIDSTVPPAATDTYDHFYVAFPFGNKECLYPLKKLTKPAQRIITGPPVRHEFTLPRTQEDIETLKQKWGIDIHKKVVVVTSGKNGSPSPYPELLARHYATTPKEEIPIHLIVLTGDHNTSFRQHLENDVKRKTHLPMSVFPSVAPDKMEELMSMSAYGGLLIGKAGGNTVFESIVRGVRLLCDEIKPGPFSNGLTHFLVTMAERFLRTFGFKNQLPWEKVNKKFGKQYGFIESVSNAKEFLPTFHKMIDNDNLPLSNPDLEIRNNEVEMRTLLEQAIEKAEAI
jgi:hypothetical protein